MPQLCTDPWYSILLCSWTIFLIFSPMKILPHQPLNDPTSQSSALKTNIWHWTW
uniref:ATP synthase complex subunit 8 n=2 Tax=Hoplobatrachus TaxID=110071 RepID=K7N7U3_HOPRU|nr:ATP synthase F0 subunit 8 [Hoplobatrachus rugulosus]YP_009633272.1 ATP synthase F0 subunit 8 [Hoplobatrachus chinensis x Hoplobatrachus rugulosus]ADG37210.1 ATPase 8 [Hoplobatrachus rugulosus]AGE11473.1 ATP synthase F0 subunit 8 [Hoplobatrachus rugulosus]QBS54607.1 ATP synthase F0 subunit 8 [Hoplobatrachus chinensis x Hoplobatrachus rugulosus]